MRASSSRHNKSAERLVRPIFLGAGLAVSLCAVPLHLLAAAAPATATPESVTSTIHVDASHAIKSFDPDVALGTSIDILSESVVDKVYSPTILKESLSAGWGPITYRQNTELQGSAWHWNPNGTWSDAAHKSGYFTGSAELGDAIRHSFGYPLPHRGNTHGDGRTRGKYSRMTDGDPNTYWKSNPYLTSKFTGEDDSLHPQWVILNLGATEKIDTLRIDWANPYAGTILSNIGARKESLSQVQLQARGSPFRLE
jgi:hypothetical protein